MSNPVDDAKLLKAQLAKTLNEFTSRTRYVVKKIELEITYHMQNSREGRRQQIIGAQLTKIILEAGDGSVIEV